MSIPVHRVVPEDAAVAPRATHALKNHVSPVRSWPSAQSQCPRELEKRARTASSLTSGMRLEMRASALGMPGSSVMRTQHTIAAAVLGTAALLGWSQLLASQDMDGASMTRRR